MFQYLLRLFALIYVAFLSNSLQIFILFQKTLSFLLQQGLHFLKFKSISQDQHSGKAPADRFSWSCWLSLLIPQERRARDIGIPNPRPEDEFYASRYTLWNRHTHTPYTFEELPGIPGCWSLSKMLSSCLSAVTIRR